jgi:nifR3 family TIM-barrel protein
MPSSPTAVAAETGPGLRPLQIGPVRIGFPVVQAALSGYSDWAMRVVARRLGAPYTLCEVLLDKFVVEVAKGRKARRFLRVTDEEHPVGAQLMGANPDDFGPAACKLVEAGFDVVDINFGCPVKKVLGRCRGGYLLGQVETALAIVDQVRQAVPPQIPVTVKMRRGLDDSSASRDRFFQIFDGAFARGVAAITVHGRTVQQRYVGPSRWEFLAEVKRHAGERTVLGSGDLFTPAACLEMIARTGVDGVTAARGAIGNPWIFPQARALADGQPLPDPPRLFEQRRVIGEHYALAEELYGAELGGRHMRKFGIKYSRLHPQAAAVRDAFVAACSPPEWRDVLDRWYSEDLPGRHPGEEVDETTYCGGEA